MANQNRGPGILLRPSDVWTPARDDEAHLARTIVNISLRPGGESVDYCVGDICATCAGVSFRGWIARMKATCRTDLGLLEEFRRMDGDVTNG